MDAHANFGWSTVLVAPVSAIAGTSLQVQAGHGDRFPVAPFNCTVCPAGTAPSDDNAEIVRVLFKTGDVFTILRTQEAGPNRAILAGDLIFNSITKKVFDDLEDAIAAAGGSAFTVGTVAPSNGDGDNGDAYLNTTTLYFYHKTAGAWVALFQGVPIVAP